jgi:hypothetical protein
VSDEKEEEAVLDFVAWAERSLFFSFLFFFARDK